MKKGIASPAGAGSLASPKPHDEDPTKWCTWRIWDQNITNAIHDHLDASKSNGKKLSKWGLGELILERIKSTQVSLSDMIDLRAPYYILQVNEINRVTFDKYENQKLKLDTELFKLANNEHVSAQDRKWDVLVEGRVAELFSKTIKIDDLLIIWNGDLDFTRKRLTLKKLDDTSHSHLITIFHQHEALEKDMYDRITKDYFMEDALSMYHHSNDNENNIVEVISPIFKQIPEPEEPEEEAVKEKTQVSSKSKVYHSNSICVIEASDEEMEDIEVITNTRIIAENEINNDNDKTATPKKTDPKSTITNTNTNQNEINEDLLDLDSQMLMNTQHVNLNDEVEMLVAVSENVKEKNTTSNESQVYSDNGCEYVNQIIDQLTFKETQELLNSNTIPQSSTQEQAHENENVNSGADESGGHSSSKLNLSDSSLQQRKILEFGDLTEDIKDKFMIKAQIYDSSGVSHQDKDKFILTVTDGTFTPFNIKEHYSKVKDILPRDTQQLKIDFPTYDILIHNGNNFRDAINRNGIKMNEHDTFLLGFITLERDNDEFFLTMDGKNFQYRKLASITDSTESQSSPNSQGKSKQLTPSKSNQQAHENENEKSDSDGEFASCNSGSGSDGDENKITKKVEQKKQDKSPQKDKSPRKDKSHQKDKVSPIKTTIHDDIVVSSIRLSEIKTGSKSSSSFTTESLSDADGDDQVSESESTSRSRRSKSKSPIKVTIKDPSKSTTSSRSTCQKNKVNKGEKEIQSAEEGNNFRTKTFKFGIGDSSSTVTVKDLYVPLIRIDIEKEKARLRMRKRSAAESKTRKETLKLLRLRGKNVKRVPEESTGDTTTEESSSETESSEDYEIERKTRSKKNKKPAVKPGVKVTPKKRKKKKFLFGKI